MFRSSIAIVDFIFVAWSKISSSLEKNQRILSYFHKLDLESVGEVSRVHMSPDRVWKDAPMS